MLLALLSIAILTATSSGTVSLSVPPHIVVGESAIISWTTGPEDVFANPVFSTSPFSTIDVGAITPGATNLTGSVSIVFKDTSTGVSLQAADKSAPSTILATTAAFQIFAAAVDSGSGGISAGGSGGTADPLTRTHTTTNPGATPTTNGSSGNTADSAGSPPPSSTSSIPVFTQFGFSHGPVVTGTSTSGTATASVTASGVSQTKTSTATSSGASDPSLTASPEASPHTISAATSHSKSKAAIIGAIVGTLIALILIAAVLLILRRRKSLQRDIPTFNREMMVRARDYRPSFIVDHNYVHVNSNPALDV
ncbi:hypothetical protein C8J56DRAFT_583221 [Mycena floridula]|nr:hypothetical protein C8J56DRAFT_583221 [Mycena floridula]